MPDKDMYLWGIDLGGVSAVRTCISEEQTLVGCQLSAYASYLPRRGLNE